MKFVFCGFDFFISTFETFISNGYIPLAVFCHKVDGIYNSSSTIKSRCSELGIPFYERNMTEVDVNFFHTMNCEIIISAAFAYRLPAEAIDSAGIMGINIHPTILPKGRGPWPLPHIILKREIESGVTLHKLAHKFDTGDILLTREFPLSKNENLESLSFKVRNCAVTIIKLFLQNPKETFRKAIPQSSGTYWAMPTEVERTLDWNLDVDHLDRIIRAFGNFESYAFFDNKNWLVQDGNVWPEKHSYIPGTVVERTNREVMIAASDGFVCLRRFKEDK